ncbi:saccharopine dehydrogenase NADP-binding domain-containing protein [Endozoicomonas sp. G2_2]|uniref:saccharopine dehydrogenase NADP-binding domain-containing protein n=1 Tax=Endozoicomonas sp. G2_2 TaxID=2821092 RepID=UPI001ADB171E|nr:saccharopine dehydrogenase NADP-binding domain-containing protein [Endozoicomonas sp. G2_2]MBO9470765.1 saccharopine dehydrogenase NADP-binding domain-containing protein [Endozoicomonas sp. G2_2]
MKHVITVSMGPSAQDYSFKTKFLGKDFTVTRQGADGDEDRAWDLLRRAQADADAVGLGMIRDHYDVGTRRFVHKDTDKLLKVVTRVPATTGADLRRMLQVRAVRHVQKTLGNYFNNALVLFLSGTVNYDIAVEMSQYTPNLSFADAVLKTGTPALLTSLSQLELFATGSTMANGIWAARKLGAVLPKLPKVKQRFLAKEMAKSHVIVGAIEDIRAFAGDGNLKGKTLLSSAIDEESLAWLKEQEVNLAIDICPQPFKEVVGINVIEAMILAATGLEPQDLSDDDLAEIIDELKLTPQLLHPTGQFRNVRRFAFIIHPLSQEAIRMGFPLLPKSTPKRVMDQIEKAAAMVPPMVYCKMTNIVSPTGSEAEGWLISVGGTPKEMLARSPEFTYRRLLAAADKAQKMGAQIIGLGAFTKVVGDAGVTVARRANLPVTTGNSYSASGALWAAADAMRRMGLVEAPKDGRVQAKTMVIGATGSIGSVSARLLAMAFDEVYLAGRDQKKLEALKASILKETPDAKVVAAADYEGHLAEMDMIVTSTSGAGKKVLDITKVKPGCVITDVARPLDLPPEECAKRPDVLVIESGEIDLPSRVQGLRDITLPKNIVYACLAETIVLALEGRFEVFTVGRDTEWRKVKEIYKLGLKHGMKLASISGVNGVYTDEDIAKVVELARERRKTWGSR